MSRKPRSPLVVFDWNFVQSVSLKQFNPPQDWDFLLPDEVVHEVVEKPDEAKIGAPELFRKLLKISSLCRSRIWLARPTDCFINYSRPLRVSQLVSAPGTEAFRKEIRSGSDRSDLVPIGRSSIQRSWRKRTSQRCGQRSPATPPPGGGGVPSCGPR